MTLKLNFLQNLKLKLWQTKEIQIFNMAKGEYLSRGSAYEKNEQRKCHKNVFVTETDGI